VKLFSWLRSSAKRLWRWWLGKLRNIELADKASPVRSEAEEAVARVVYRTNIAPDCVSATVLQGGYTIIIEHNKSKEAFIHRSYDQAADKAIEWLTKREGRHVLSGTVSHMNRAQRRAFDKKRKKQQRRR